jgi:polyisoprenoid-binding protein YceI
MFVPKGFDMVLGFSRPLLALTLGAVSLLAQAQQVLVPAQSEITFVSRQMGVPVSGKFTRFDAQIAFDPAQSDKGRVQMSVDTGSATLGVRESDAELPKPLWFNVAQFPKATFTSSSIKRRSATEFDVAGKLSIKGVSTDVNVPVTVVSNGATLVASGAFPIQRLQFRIGDKEWADTSVVADAVQVRFKVVLK